MALDRPIEKAREAAGDVREFVGQLPWLPDPFRCDECGAPCEETVAFDPVLVETTPAWECPECDAQYRRDAESGYTFDIWRGG